MVTDYSRPMICEKCKDKEKCECYWGIRDLKNLAWSCLPDEVTEEVFKALAKFKKCECFEEDVK